MRPTLISDIKRFSGIADRLAARRLTKADLVDLGYAASERAAGLFDGFTALDLATKPNDIVIRGPIVDEAERTDWEFWGYPATSPESFSQDLAATEGDVRLILITPGGRTDQAGLINQIIMEAQKEGRNIHALVVLAASAGSIILAQADTSSIIPLGYIYVHRPLVYLRGYYYEDPLIEEAVVLGDLKPQLAKYYDKLGVDYKSLGFKNAMALMLGRSGDGVWILAEKAVASGFVGYEEEIEVDRSDADTSDDLIDEDVIDEPDRSDIISGIDQQNAAIRDRIMRGIKTGGLI